MVPNRDGETNRSYMQDPPPRLHEVSFLDVVEAHVQAGGKLKDVWIPGMNMVHPARRAHEGFADVICRLFNAELDALDSGGPAAAAADDLEPPVARRDFDDPDPLPWLHEASSDVPHSCMPVTRHVPDAPTKATPRRSRRGTWQLAEDSPGKPGWIAQGSPTARSPKQDDWLEFPVAFGSRPVLTVQFVKSYSGMGDAEVRLLEKAYTLRGYWESSSSQAFTVYFNASAPHSAEPIGEVSYVRHGFGVTPNSEGTLQVRLVAGAKFKLLGVFTC
ncbi:unnamed protein product [Prorocentrum cordatum]|uniref:Restriction endonuclease domain-containing protein n=1 Tax=Prorocentrum cordatum TaxID=2364126 RepID=A0ABN9YGI3_9DINO|nr:unnamed protein product [Polarella glacialis]